MIALPWKNGCVRTPFYHENNHYGFLAKCPTSFYNRPVKNNGNWQGKKIVVSFNIAVNPNANFETGTHYYDTNNTSDSKAGLYDSTGMVIEVLSESPKVSVAIYAVTYSFVSGTEDYELPDAINAYLPAAGTANNGDAITPTAPSETTFTNADGTWTFQGWTPASAEVDGADVAFVGTWTFTATPKGSLTITKTISGNRAQASDEFEFTITFTEGTIDAPEDGALSESEGENSETTGYHYKGTLDGTKEIEGYLPYEGGTINLRGGGSVTIDNIREGTQYSVKETKSLGYSVSFTGEQGVINDETGAVAAFRNTKSYSPPDYPYDPPVLNKEDHYAYIVGYPDGNVGPNNEITRAEVATIFFRMLTDVAREKYWSTTNSFTDVNAGDWYNNAISTLANLGIINGYPDGSFGPNNPVTRAELVKMAVSFFDFVTENHTTLFSDIKGHWAEEYIVAAAEMGFINGYPDETFRPNNNITRAEAMKIINNVLGRVPHKDHLLNDMIVWPDNMDKNAWYYADVQEATNSHDYTWHNETTKDYENWIKLLPVRDWATLEKAWEANAVPNPGEVVD